MRKSRHSDRLSLYGRQLSPDYEVRWVVMTAGAERRQVPPEWSDALVVVEEGEIELECTGGSAASFSVGAVVYFGRLPIRCLRNKGKQPAVLSLLARSDPPPATPFPA
jgi:hypothetical protein